MEGYQFIYLSTTVFFACLFACLLFKFSDRGRASIRSTCLNLIQHNTNMFGFSNMAKKGIYLCSSDILMGHFLLKSLWFFFPF